MGKCVIKLDGKYMQWTSISDSPCSPLLPEPFFKRYWDVQYGLSGGFDYLIAMRDLERNNGCSAFGYSIDRILRNNRAGEGEKHLSKAQIIEEFTMTDEKEFEEWLTALKKSTTEDNAKWAEKFKQGA